MRMSSDTDEDMAAGTSAATNNEEVFEDDLPIGENIFA
jgi:hypothetical protein